MWSTTDDGDEDEEQEEDEPRKRRRTDGRRVPVKVGSRYRQSRDEFTYPTHHLSGQRRCWMRTSGRYPPLYLIGTRRTAVNYTAAVGTIPFEYGI